MEDSGEVWEGERAGDRPGRSRESAAAQHPLCLTVTIPSQRPASPVTAFQAGTGRGRCLRRRHCQPRGAYLRDSST
ncbi:hypothetical protein NN561_013377 [Cricetulus griseus]